MSALSRTVDRLRRLASSSVPTERSDRQLLTQFSQNGEEAAFAALVYRHSSLVYGVCRRVLGHAQDAEDAFQAAFLVLARKAGQLRWHESIKNWLHGVAYRVALKARARGRRRRCVEHSARAQAADANLNQSWDDLRTVLDEELARLPVKYRAPLLLCLLEGKTRDEAASELGWTPGSVKGRLERGRELLRARLLKRGLPLAAVLCASFLGDTVSAAAVPAALAAATIQAGLTFSAGFGTLGVAPVSFQLAQGVLNAMLITKIKAAVFGTFLLAVLGMGSSLLIQDAVAGRAQASLGVVPSVGSVIPAAMFQERPAQAAGEKREPERKQKEGKQEERKKDGAPRKDEREDNAIRGVVKSLDLAKGTITLLGGGERDTGERTFSLAGKNVKVTLNGTERVLTLADLIPKTLVFLKLDDAEDVVAIRAQPIVLTRIVAGVDAAKRQITVAGEREGQETLSVAPDARLFLNEKQVSLDQYKAGTRVNLTLALNQKTVLAINVLGNREILRDGAPREGALRDGVAREGAPRDGDPRPEIMGLVTAVYPDRNILEVLTGGDDNPVIRSVTVPRDFKIQFRAQGRDLALGDLTKTTKVAIYFGPDKKSVTRIDLIAPLVRTTVQSIDVRKRTITFGERTLEVAADARIALNRQQIPLTSLAPGMRVQLTLNPERTQVVVINAFRGDGER